MFKNTYAKESESTTLIELKQEVSVLAREFESWIFLTERLRSKYKEWAESNAKDIMTQRHRDIERCLKIISQDCKYLAEDLKELQDVFNQTNEKEQWQ